MAILLAGLAGLGIGRLLRLATDSLVRVGFAGAISTPESYDSPEPAWWRGAAQGEWGWRGVIVELFNALLLAYLWSRYGASWRILELVFYGCVLQLIALADLRHWVVPNAVVYPAIPLTLVLQLISSRQHVLRSLVGGGAGFTLFLLLMLASPKGWGAGDVKLAALVGLMLGFPQGLWALALGILAGGVGALVVLITRRGTLKSYMPYAPFLCVGALVALLCPPPSALTI